MDIDPSWISSSLLAVIGALLIAIGVLALLLIESKRARARMEATLEASVARHKALLREHRDNLAVIDDKHQARLAEQAKDHTQELEGMLGILAIADIDRDEALKDTAQTTQRNNTLKGQLDEIRALMESWATGQDDTAKAIRHHLSRTLNQTAGTQFSVTLHPMPAGH